MRDSFHEDGAFNHDYDFRYDNDREEPPQDTTRDIVERIRAQQEPEEPKHISLVGIILIGCVIWPLAFLGMVANKITHRNSFQDEEPTYFKHYRD